MNQSNLQVRPSLPKNKHKDKFSQILTTSNFVAKNFLIVLCWQKHLLIVFNCYISNNVIEIYISYHITCRVQRHMILNFVAKNFLIVLCWKKHLLIVFNCYISNKVIEIYISYHIIYSIFVSYLYCPMLQCTR